MRILQRCLDDPTWIAAERRARCIEHIMHITARDVVTTVCPAPSQFKKAQYPSDSEDEGEDDNFDENDDEAEDTETVDFEANDILGKLLALINQVCTFPIC